MKEGWRMLIEQDNGCGDWATFDLDTYVRVLNRPSVTFCHNGQTDRHTNLDFIWSKQQVKKNRFVC